MAPRGKEEEKKDEDPMKALLKLSVKNANSAAFQDMADSRITAEQVCTLSFDISLSFPEYFATFSCFLSLEDCYDSVLV